MKLFSSLNRLKSVTKWIGTGTLLLSAYFACLNGFQQGLVQYQLPSVSVSHLLNNKDKYFSADVNASKDVFDSVAGYFDTNYLSDYLKGYKNYSVVLYPTLTVSRASTGFSFVLDKRLNATEPEPRKAEGVISKAVFEFKQYRRAVSVSSIGLEFHFGIDPCLIRGKSGQQFVNSTVYPLYSAGRPSSLSKVRKVDSVIGLYDGIQTLQTLIFWTSLVLIFPICTSSLLIPWVSLSLMFGLAFCLGVFNLISLSFTIALAAGHTNTTFGEFNVLMAVFQMIYTIFALFVLTVVVPDDDDKADSEDEEAQQSQESSSLSVEAATPKAVTPTEQVSASIGSSIKAVVSFSSSNELRPVPKHQESVHQDSLYEDSPRVISDKSTGGSTGEVDRFLESPGDASIFGLREEMSADSADRADDELAEVRQQAVEDAEADASAK